MSAPETLEGWYALHDLRVLERAAWNECPPSERQKALAEAADALAGYERLDNAPEGRSVTYSILGHKADLLMFHLRPEIDQLRELENDFDRTLLASYMTRSYSYLSVVEMSRHGSPEGTAQRIEDTPHIQARLYPEIPEHSRYLCFYPMNKKREGADNWYLLSAADRADLMRAHGQTGRRYSGKVTQIVTGSVGLDDWEWGVTLFSDDPVQFKKLIYEMRFDEVSARYAEFGPFYVGRRLSPQDLGENLGR